MKSPIVSSTNKFAAPYVDRQRRSCIVVDRTESEVKVIKLNVEFGLDVETLPTTSFGREWNPLVDYPVDRAAKLYVSYARQIGATEAALTYLGKLTTVTKEDITMATAKKTAKTDKPKTPIKGKSSLKGKGPSNEATALDASVKTGTKKTDLPANSKVGSKPANPKAGAKKAAEKKPAKAKGEKAPSTRGPSASSRFQELIMEGKLTDDAIFAKVQKEFGLDDKKRSYVSWYRNHLRKGGAKVPDAKTA